MFLEDYLRRRIQRAFIADDDDHDRDRDPDAYADADADADADDPEPEADADDPEPDDDPDSPFFRRQLGETMSYCIYYVSMTLATIVVILTLLGFVPRAYPMANQTITDQQFYRRQLPGTTSFYEKAKGSYIPEIIDVRVIYTDSSGVVRFKTVKSSNLSGASWVWKAPSEITDYLTDPIAHGEAILDEVDARAIDQEKQICAVLSLAKEGVYDCNTDVRKLMAIIQSEEGDINAQSEILTFLTQLTSNSVPEELYCLTLLLKAEYYERGYLNMKYVFSPKLEDPLLYHYAIFSNNVLATSVVVNSAVTNARKPAKHVFHIVTDMETFTAMKMWFIAHPPGAATIQVENLDDFTWLNSSYFPILGQQNPHRLQEYSLKDLSPLNHLRFYLPDVYPKLDKILFLDDDTVFQKDLTALWSIDLKGMVNGAVETCKNSDPTACGWAFGMNIFDLKEWKRRNITGIYRHLQNMNDDWAVWQVKTMPAGLIAFYNLTYSLDPKWHLLKLGYETGLDRKDIKKAAVIHYSGPYKPWLDIAITEYKPYWSKYIVFDGPRFLGCNLIH